MQLEPDEIRNYQQAAFFHQEHSRAQALTPFTIFVAVLAAIVCAWALRAVYIEWQVRQALHVLNQEMLVINAQAQQQAEAMRLRNLHMQQAAEQRAYQQRLAAHQQLLAVQAEKAAKINLRNSKAEAWAAYYSPSPECANDHQTLMVCANEHARAKKHFDLAWHKQHPQSVAY